MMDNFNCVTILHHLRELIRLQGIRLQGGPRKSADDTRDWLAINFLFRVGREYQHLSGPARDQLDVIFHGWTSPEPLTLREFRSMLEVLRALIASDCRDVQAA